MADASAAPSSAAAAAPACASSAAEGREGREVSVSDAGGASASASPDARSRQDFAPQPVLEALGPLGSAMAAAAAIVAEAADEVRHR